MQTLSTEEVQCDFSQDRHPLIRVCHSFGTLQRRVDVSSRGGGAVSLNRGGVFRLVEELTGLSGGPEADHEPKLRHGVFGEELGWSSCCSETLT